MSNEETAVLEALFAAAKDATDPIRFRIGTEAELQRVAVAYDLSAELEAFLTNNVNSAWAPAVHVHLAQHYRQRGQTTRALAHWQAAWNLTDHYGSGRGKETADEALANLSLLLVLLGRTDELTKIYQATSGRILDHGGPFTQIWVRVHEKYLRMHKYPHDD